MFTNKVACCDVLSQTKVWDQLWTKAQGICAVPDDQWKCYIPDTGSRACREERIDKATSKGCTGKGLEVRRPTFRPGTPHDARSTRGPAITH